MSEIDYRRLASGLAGAAQRAGARIMAQYGSAEAELKEDQSPVTAADREAEAVLLAALAGIEPDTPVIAEESAPAPDADPGLRFFLVDPLDGTREFIGQRGEFTVNVALVADGVPRFGLVYAPALGRLFITLAADRAGLAEMDPHGAPADLDALAFRSIRTRTPPADGLTAVVSRSHFDDATRAFLENAGVTGSAHAGSSIKFCLIAQGEADVYPRFGRTMEWDTAAGHAVLAAAGGAVVDETGAPLTYGKRARGYANPGFVAWGRPPGSS